MPLTVEQIRSAIKRVCDGKTLDNVPDSGRLRDLGFDSLDMFNILLEIETLTGHAVPDEDIESLQSIQGIYEYIGARGQ